MDRCEKEKVYDTHTDRLRVLDIAIETASFFILFWVRVSLGEKMGGQLKVSE